MFMFVYLCIYVCISVCMYIGIYLCTYVHACMFRFGSGEGGYTDLVQLESLMDDVEPAPSEKQIKEKVGSSTSTSRSM